MYVERDIRIAWFWMTALRTRLSPLNSPCLRYPRKFPKERRSTKRLNLFQAMAGNEHNIDNLSNISIAHAASIIEEISESRKWLLFRPIYNQWKIKWRKIGVGFVSQRIPCASTYYICKITDWYFDIFVSKKKQRVDCHVWPKQIL